MQRLGVVDRLWTPLMAGEKRSTIRFGEPPIVVGPLTYVNDDHPLQTAGVMVTRVTRMKLSDAAAFLGRRDEWPDDVMLEGMREHYPTITLDDEVQVIEHSAPLRPWRSVSASLASAIILAVSAGAFIFTVATSPSDPSEHSLPLLTLGVLIGTASALVVAWSWFLGDFGRIHPVTKTALLTTIVVCAIVIASIVSA